MIDNFMHSRARMETDSNVVAMAIGLKERGVKERCYRRVVVGVDKDDEG